MFRLLHCLILVAMPLAFCAESDSTRSVIPNPPRQTEPWTPPASGLGVAFNSAVKLLFDIALPDPRGCEYREIEIASHEGGEIVKTHGWILPRPAGATEQFAIAWDGLIYPILKVGGAADARADMDALIEADRKFLVEAFKKHAKQDAESAETRRRHGEKDASPNWPQIRTSGWHDPEIPDLRHTEMSDFKAAYCLRLGLGEQARKIWAQDHAAEIETDAIGIQSADPFSAFASSWLNAAAHHAFHAHETRDDSVALHYFRTLVRVQPLLETEDRRRDKSHRQPPATSCLPANMSAMLADQERRAREAPREPLRTKTAGCRGSDSEKKFDAGSIPDQHERIARLIRELDEVAQDRFWSMSDWICLALKDEGDAAVDALLECYEKDTRMTRAKHIYISSNFDTYATIITVRETSSDILYEILGMDFQCLLNRELKADEKLTDDERRTRTIRIIRREREKFKGLAQEECWYRQLADDAMPAEIWMSAARSITSQLEVGYVYFNRPPPKTAVKLYGDALRDGRTPSVTELFSKRMNASLKAEKPQDAKGFADALERWEGKAPLAALREISELLKIKGSTNPFGGPFEATDMDIHRFELGDRRALAEHLAWLKQVPPPDWDFEKLLAFLWHFPDEPEVEETAQFIFNDPASKWAALFVAPRRKDMDHGFKLLYKPLLGVKGFQEFALRQLADKSAAGRVTVLADGKRDLESTIFSLSESDTAPSDPLGRTPRPGEQFEFRMCDVAARNLSYVPGYPRCELHWDEATRDRAVARCIGVLKRYGERSKFSAQQAKLMDFFGRELPVMLFPALASPATPEDVENGTAIFFIPHGEGETRIWKLPKYPLKAQWMTLKNHPCLKRNSNDEAPSIVYSQEGYVWQAEEVLKDGKWQRYYGFVGAHEIEKVRAEEIEFIVDNSDDWRPLANGIDCCVAPVKSKDLDREYPPRKPKRVEIRLRNRSGTDRFVPAEFVRSDALRAGVEIKLLTISASDPDYKKSDDKKANWKEVPAKLRNSFAGTAATRALTPAEEFVIVEFEFDTWFDASAPGKYKLEVRFTDEKDGLGTGAAEFQFTVCK